jgi:hypothetical protein
MIKGNHDYYFRTKRTDEIYDNFKNVDNLIFLDNEQADLLGIKITCFAPTRETYHATKHGKHSQELSLEQFKKQNFSLSENDFNLVLTHSPITLSNKIMEQKGKEFYKKADVVLSGHMHNGLLFSKNFEWIVRILKNEKSHSPIKKIVKKYADTGVWYVYKTCFLIRWCRGARFFGKGDNTVYLPSSKSYSEIKLYNHPDETLQITTKGVNKYAVIPFFVGRPSVVELKISPCKSEK